MPGTTSSPANTVFDSARPLLVEIEPWNRYGFAVPNFGRQIGTLSLPIWRLVNECGKCQLDVMTDDDARREDYPSPNTISKIAKMVNLVQSALVGRQLQANDFRIKAGKAAQNPRVWLMHPVPFFESSIVNNGYLMEYNELIMIALTNMIRHDTNNLALTVTAEFAQDVWIYFKEIKLRICTELLGMTITDANDDTKPMPTGPYAGPGTRMAPATGAPTYNPAAMLPNMMRLREGGPMFDFPGPDDLRPFARGIPANLLIPSLGQYPVGPIPGMDGLSGENVTVADALIGANATSGPGGSMGANLGVTSSSQAVIDAVTAAAGPVPGTPAVPAPGPAAVQGVAAASGAAGASGAAAGTIAPPNT